MDDRPSGFAKGMDAESYGAGYLQRMDEEARKPAPDPVETPRPSPRPARGQIRGPLRPRRSDPTAARLTNALGAFMLLRRKAAGSAAVMALRALDDDCAARLDAWTEGPVTPAPGLRLAETLVLGLLVSLDVYPLTGTVSLDKFGRPAVHGGPGAIRLLRLYAPTRRPVLRRRQEDGRAGLAMPPDLRWLLMTLAASLRRQGRRAYSRRIRRCMAWHNRSPGAQCVAFFLDRSPAGRARACPRPAHSERTSEALAKPMDPDTGNPRAVVAVSPAVTL